MERHRFNWMQRYAGSEMVELADEGRIDRRELMRRLVGICGSAAAAAAFLAACSSDDAGNTATSGDAATTVGADTTAAEEAVTSSSPTEVPTTSAAPTTTIAEPGSTLVEPPLGSTSGAILSVAPDDPDVIGTDVTFAGPTGDVFGYLAVPTAPGARAAVLVNHEIFGLTDHIRDVARRLAKAGYIAMAVDLASRIGGSDAGGDVPAALTQGPVEDRVADLDAGLAHLETLPAFDGRLGVVGFCFGGGMTLSYSAAQPRVLAAVPYYGPTPEPASVMSATNAAILAQYGATDARVNAGIPDLEAAMAGKTFEQRVHDGAGHAFNNDTGGAYVEAVAVEAWTATLAWFATHLV